MDDGSPPPRTAMGAIKTEVEKFRFGGGVVNNTTAVMVAAFVAMATIAVALSSQPFLAAGMCVLVGLFAAYYLRGTWSFADKHPDLAALGGSEYLRSQELQMGTKDIPHIDDAQQNMRPPPVIGSEQ